MSNLVWTPQPAAGGWHWLRALPDGRPVIVFVDGGSVPQAYCNGQHLGGAAAIVGEWAGPLLPPSTPPARVPCPACGGWGRLRVHSDANAPECRACGGTGTIEGGPT